MVLISLFIGYFFALACVGMVICGIICKRDLDKLSGKKLKKSEKNA